MKLTNEIRGRGEYWSHQKLVCWWKSMFQTRPTVFQSSKWNLLHMIPMMSTYTWHIYWEGRLREFQSSKWFYIHLGKVCVLSKQLLQFSRWWSKWLFIVGLISCEKVGKVGILKENWSLFWLWKMYRKLF